MNVFQKMFGTHSEREVKRIMPLVEKIEKLRPTMIELSDEELRGKTAEYKKRLAEGETLDDLLPEAYATVRESARRVLNMEHYRVQLIGGIILHQGRIAEMRTGEGKTLVSTLPAYLNALEGKGVHVVTVNDYLAHRDSEWMGKVHEFLGLTVGCVLNSMDSEERRKQYNCDITYITNNEDGFDYLRDNMVIYKEQLVQRDLHYAIIDEVDSVLIDEARTPLIISGQSGKSTKLYEVCDILAKQLERGEASGEVTKMSAIMGEEITETGDYIVNEKDKVVTLTQDGVKKVEQFFQIDNLSDPENLEIQHNINLALRAHSLMHRDQDYVVKDDEVLIVDEFTGRIMPGRRYSDGLHQAIEAKEHVKVKRESKTLATITFQNFFNKYKKKAGMTGTALTEEKEFRDIYGMDVVEIPTNRPVLRKDLDDAVYMTKKEKFHAVVDEIEKAHPDVFNILLQVLDDGHITDSQGRKVDFKNTIIIMTSNAGAQSIIEPKKLGFGAKEDEKQDHERMKASVMEEVKRIFKPEFLNRIDETIVFRALNKDDMKKIIGIMVRDLQKRCKEQLQIDLVVREAAKEFIVEKAYDRKYGARPLRRKLQDEVEDRLADALIRGEIHAKDRVIVTTKNKEIIVSKDKK